MHLCSLLICLVCMKISRVFVDLHYRNATMNLKDQVVQVQSLAEFSEKNIKEYILV